MGFLSKLGKILTAPGRNLIGANKKLFRGDIKGSLKDAARLGISPITMPGQLVGNAPGVSKLPGAGRMFAGLDRTLVGGPSLSGGAPPPPPMAGPPMGAPPPQMGQQVGQALMRKRLMDDMGGGPQEF